MKIRHIIPWRVIGFVGLMIVVTLFTALNLENSSNVSIGLHTFVAVPVFMTSLISFTLGVIIVLPLSVRRRDVASAKKNLKGNDAENRRKDVLLTSKHPRKAIDRSRFNEEFSASSETPASVVLKPSVQKMKGRGWWNRKSGGGKGNKG